MANRNHYNNFRNGEAQRRTKFEQIYRHDLLTSESESFRVIVSLKDGMPLVGLSKFYLNPENNHWYPTKKHFFVRAEQWLAMNSELLKAVKEVSELGLPGTIFISLSSFKLV